MVNRILFQVTLLMVVVMATCCAAVQVTTFQASFNISTIAGTGNGGFNGDGQLAINADIQGPASVAMNSLGELFIADYYNHRIRKVLLNGTITTIAGTGNGGFNGDGQLAIYADIQNPQGVAVNSLGEVIISDCVNHRIRKVLLNGTISTIAGTGNSGFNGDGQLAINADINYPQGVAVNSMGEVIFVDRNNFLIRKILLNGTIITVAGSGIQGYNGDGQLATSADLNNPVGVAVNSLGEVYIADTDNYRIRKVLLNGTITTIAGTGVQGFNGDDQLAINADIQNPQGVAVNSLGEVFIADTYNNRIRKILLNGTITTIAGIGGTGGYNGDGISSLVADIQYPLGVAVNSLDEILIADTDNHRIRKLNGYCPGSNSILSGVGQQCNCLAGYYGEGGQLENCNKYNCSNVAHDSLGVCSSNGQCVSPNNCTCKSGFYGTNCELFDCYGTPKTNSKVCSGSGQCSGVNNCTCNTGYSGSNCDSYYCDNVLFNDTNVVCSGSGQCKAPNNCSCNSGYYGNNCELFTCSNTLFNDTSVCSSVGKCIAPNNCSCNNGRYGSNCEFFTCNNLPFNDTKVCSSFGKCISLNNCTCTTSGYYGTNCEQFNCFGIASTNVSAVCSGRGVCSGVDTCVCQSGFVGQQCALYNISSALSVSFNATQGFISESSTSVRVVINNSQYAAFYKTRSVTARFTFTLESTNPIVVNVIFPAASSSYEGIVPPFAAVGKVSVSVQFSDTESGIVISDNVPSTNTLTIVNRSVVNSASQSSYLIALLICLAIIQMITLF